MEAEGQRPNQGTANPAEAFARLWRGEQSLGVAFWFFFVAGSVFVPIIVGMCTIPLYMLDQPIPARWLMFLAFTAYPIFAAIGVWRSANVRARINGGGSALGTKFAVCFVLLALASRLTGVNLTTIIRLLNGQ